MILTHVQGRHFVILIEFRRTLLLQSAFFNEIEFRRILLPQSAFFYQNLKISNDEVSCYNLTRLLLPGC